MTRSPTSATELADAIARVRAYLDEMDRVNNARLQYADDVHGINDRHLSRSDLKTIITALEVA